MKVVFGTFQQESNSFSPVECGLDKFKKQTLVYGEDVIRLYQGTRTQGGGFLSVLGQEEAVVIPSISARTGSSGPVTEEAYLEVESTILRVIKENWPIDGVALALHGATILTEHYDGVGRLLERIRMEVGDEVIIAGSMDFHANVTDKMIRSADILIGYHKYPHIDKFEVSYDAARLLVKAIKGEINPVMAMCKLPMIHQAEACMTDEYPFKKISDRVAEVEAKEGVLSASVFQMQPWMDLEDAGAGIIVIADGDRDLATSYSKSLAREYWDLKEELIFELTPLNEAVQRAVTIEEGPVVITDSADSPSAGAPGDSTAVLDYLLSRNIDVETLITMVDSAAVEQAVKTGVGGEGDFSLGGKINKNFKPVTIRGTVKKISDGKFAMQRSGHRGLMQTMGRTAVIQCGKISVVVMELSSAVQDPALYLSVGLDPKAAKLVVVKSALAFRELYEDIAREIYVVDTPGVTSSNILALPFKNLNRPIYPFDDIKSLDIHVRALGHQRKP